MDTMVRIRRAALRRLIPSPLRRAVAAPIATSIDCLFNRQIYARARKRTHVLCIGDSHVQVMRRVRVPGAWLRVKSLYGATASGVMNPNSATHSLSTFTKRLRRAKPWQEVLIQLGEVDCGFVIWHRAQRHGLSIDEQLAHTLDSYTAFIGRVVDLGFRRTIVLSAPLPTIGDYQSEWGEVANLRAEVTATQAERTNLTLRFNEQLRERCDAIGVTFVDVTTGHYDPSTRLIDRRFLRTTYQDHHLADRPYARLISGELRKVWL
jgi:hypothetical protein